MSKPRQKWKGGQNGHIPLQPNNNNKKKKEGGTENDYFFIQLCDTQLGMMSSMRQGQWKRPFVRLITCGSLVMPPLLEPAPEAQQYRNKSRGGADDRKGEEEENNQEDEDEERYALTDAALDQLEQDICKLAVDAINEMNPPPSFVVVCGDLVREREIA
jgi:hypothetical protein